MPASPPPTIAALAASGTIGPDDVRRLRGTVYANGVVCAEEAEWAILLDEAATRVCPDWTEFFIGSLTDYVVRQEPPEGYVSDANAAWLISRISRDGVVKTSSELELLIKVLEVSVSSPPSLSAFALRQVASAVIDGQGPLADGSELQPGVIGAAEVAILRRILFAFGGDGAIGITREEAEVLFDLNDRSLEAGNDVAWSDLFVKAIANFLMASKGYSVLSRREALRREDWLDEPPRGVTALFGDMTSALLANGLKGIWRDWREEETAQAVGNREALAEIQAAEVVTSDEVRWLAERIGRDGVIHENERALLRFLREESPDIHPSLRTLLDTAA
ncbi:MAG TPA: hypothetical protein VMP03_09105 [Methylomirabilota bacterium]|nr:hypothetical protein [Methylomirabilota bacterium]